MEYRGNQCPERGPGLSHTQEGSYKSGSRCTHCDTPITSRPPTNVPPSATEAAPPLDVQERLKEVGLWPPSDQLPGPVKDTDPIFREPKMITGTGPTGPKRGEEKVSAPAYGRLPFTVEDEKRILFHVLMVRDLSSGDDMC